MACNCNKLDYECLGVKTSSNCITWRGSEYPALDICPGDTLTYVEEIILNYIVSKLEEAEIPPDVDLSTCPAMQQALAGRDSTVDNLLQILIDNQCTLKDLIEEVEAKIPTDSPYAFTLKCVTPVGTQSDPNAIIQGLINVVCSLKTTVDELGSTIDDIIDTKVGDFMGNAIKSLGNRGIAKTGSGASSVYTFLALVPPLCPIPYVGPLSNFDGDGKGVVGTAYEGWYLLNGSFGTLDARGRAIVASVSGVPGGSLDAAVDPGNVNNPGTNYTTGFKFGSSYVTLNTSNMPAHTHTATQTTHSHPIPLQRWLTRPQGGGSEVLARRGVGTGLDGKIDITINTDSVAPAITVSSTGGGSAHENRQPSLVVTGYIMRFD